IRAASLILSLYVFRDYWARQFLLLGKKPLRPAAESRETAPETAAAVMTETGTTGGT
ncbi:MAG: hypothetical protein GX624_13000, partial [Actinobacteria bacterium]|nr:hypothetical protein [Actinomycetota bacterium]